MGQAKLTKLAGPSCLSMAAAALCLCAASRADATASLSGYWKLVSGSRAQAPALTPWGQHNRVKTKSDIDVEAVRWCVRQGMPFVMDRSVDLDFIQAPNEIVILGENLSIPRHIYTAGRSHPDASVFDNSPVGDSRGRWEGNTLVVRTIGFEDGVGPAGVPRTTRSLLTEKFIVSGDRLKVVSTWSDAKTLRKPFTYTLTYKRMPASYYPEEHYCDPRKNGVVQ